MVAVNKVVDEHVFRYRTEGVEQTRAQADVLAKSQGNLAKSSEGVAESSAGAERSARDASDAYGGLSARSEAAAKMAAAMERAQRQADAAMAQAALDANALQESLSGVADAQARAAQAGTKAAQQTAKAANDNAAAASGYAESLASVVKFAAEHQIATLAIIAGTTRAMGGFAGVAAGALGTASEATRRYANENDRLGEKASAAAGKVADGLSTAADLSGKAGDALGALSARMTPGSAAAGVLVRTLGMVGGMLGPISLLFGAFAVGSALIDRANSDLAKLVDLAQRAEKLDMSGPLVKSFEGAGKLIGLEVDQIAAALEKASGLLREKYGQDNPLSKVLADLDAAGDSDLSEQVRLQAELAQTTGQRFQVALDAMRELEASGKRLALLDLADKLLGPEFAERLRTGQITVRKFTDDLDAARGKELLKQEDVARAISLQREIAQVKREIEAAWESTIDFSGAAVKVKEAWLGILGVSRDVLRAVNDSMNMTGIDVLKGKIAQIENFSIPFATSKGQDDVVRSLNEQLVNFRAELERLSATATKAKPELDVSPQLRATSDAIVRLSEEADRAKTIIPGLDSALINVALAAGAAAFKIGGAAEAIRGLQNLNPNLSGILGYFDKVGAAQKQYVKALQDADLAFQKPGTVLTGNEDALIRSKTQAMEEYRLVLKAVEEQRNKPLNDIVTEADRTKLTDLGRSLAQVGDRTAAVRKDIENGARVAIGMLSDPARGLKPEEIAAQTEAIQKQAQNEIGRLETAGKLLEAKAKSDAATNAAKEAADSSKSDQLDNALQRTKDETDELRQQAEVLGNNRLEYYKMTEANQLWRAARKAGRQDEAGIADEIDKAADAYARQRTQTDRLTDAHQRMQDAFRDGAGEIADFLDQWVLKGGKFADILKSTTSTLSSGALKGLLTGEGMMGTLLGLAPTEKGQLGGLLGGKGSLLGFDLSDLRKTFASGFGEGFDRTFGPMLEPAKNAAGQSMGFMSSGLGRGLASAGIGASIGYSSASPLMGIAGGALAGASLGPWGAVVGGAAGLIGGLLGKSEAKKQAKKRIEEQLKAYREAYDQAKPEIEKLRATFRGESLGGVGLQIDAAFQQALAANKTASQAGDQKTADQIMVEFTRYAFRLRDVFMNAFEGTLSEVAAGFGTSGPFAQANAAVASLGETLKAFVADSLKLPEPEKNGPRARLAAQQAALAALDPPKALSDTQSRLVAIQGTAAGLGRVLQDLGMSADEAAKAIRDRTAVAMKALRAEFSADLKARANEATGKGYLNEVADLVKEREGLLADARAIGAGTADVTAYFRASAQKIIDSSELTGAAFADLVKRFPALKGAVVEFGQAIDTAAAKAEAAARALGYQDRAFAAGNDTGTLAGALAAQDRKAAQDRAAEAKAGGRAMADLEKALAAERTAIIRDFAARAEEAEKATAEATARRVLSAEDRLFAARNDSATLEGKLAEMERQHAQERAEEVKAGGQALVKLEEAQAAERLKIVREAGAAEAAARKQALAEAQTFLDGQVKGIRTYLDGLKAGPETSLSPGARLKEAQAQFDRQLKLAKGGDRDALGSLTTYADRLLDAGKGQFASGKGYQDILGSVTKQLGALPKQVSAEQFIADAIKAQTSTLQTAIGTGSAAEIAKALSGNFAKLDKDGSGGLSLAEFKAALGPKATTEQQVMAAGWFKQIDANGDGQITQAELQRAEMKELFKANPDLIQRALNLKGTKLDINKDGLLSYKEYLVGLGPLATQDQQIMAAWWFKQIDANGDGLLDKTELMRGQLLLALQTNSAQNIASAIKTNFPRLDINKDGLLSTKEFLAGLGPLATKEQQAAASWWFKQIDENGDGQLSKLELLRTTLKTTIEANPALIQKALATDFGRLDANMDGKLTEAEFLAGLGPLATKEQQAAASWWYKQIDENGDGLLSKTELMRGQLLTALAANSPALISQALQTNFKNIDINKDGLLSSKEYLNSLGTLTKSEADAATKLFNKLDANNDGQLSKLELIRARAEKIDGATAGTKDSATDTATAVKDGNTTAKAMQSLLATQKTVLDGIQGYQKAANDNLAVARESLASLKTSSGIQDEQLRLLNKQYTLASPVRVSGSSAVLNNGMLDALNKIVFNTGMTASGLIKLMSTGKPDGLMFAFAEGGWVRGPGSGTSDSIGARLSNGEFVVNAAAARLNAPFLEAMNDNRSLMMPALAMPVPVAGAGMDAGALLAELQALRAEVRTLRTENKAGQEMQARVTKAGADKVAGKVEETTDEVAGSRDDARRDAAPKRAGRGEPVRSAA